jgi:hypothetical protein
MAVEVGLDLRRNPFLVLIASRLVRNNPMVAVVTLILYNEELIELDQ